MPKIRDALYGDIPLEEHELDILHTSEFLRLGRLYQLPFAHLVYPCASHLRSSHAIGVLFLADKIARNLSLPDNERKLVRVAGLLHDIEEPSLHSITKPLINKLFGEDFLNKTRRQRIVSTCEKVHMPTGINSDSILEVLQGKGYRRQIIDSIVGANIIDYIVRDNYFSGVNYGLIDTRILSSCSIKDGELVLHKEGLPIVESILYCLYQMTLHVYNHRVIRSILCLLEKSLKKKKKLLETSVDVGDCKFFSKIDPNIRQRIENRQLPKKAYELDSYLLYTLLGNEEEVLETQTNLEHHMDDIINEIHERSKVLKDWIYLDFISRKELKDLLLVKVQINNTISSLNKASRIISGWEKSFFEQWRMYVFCEIGYREVVENACKDIFSFLNVEKFNSIGAFPEVVEFLRPIYKTIYEQKPRPQLSKMKRKIFMLSRRKLEVLKTLAKIGEASAKQVADNLEEKKARSTTNIILNNLEKEELVQKRRKGRKVFFEIKDEVKKILSEFLV